MGLSVPSQSDSVIRPRSLMERLAVETPAEPEAIAERFAPNAPKSLDALSARAFIEPQRLQDLVPKPLPSSNRALLVASMLVSLAPTAIILGLLWQGAIRFPITESTTSKSESAPLVETQQASLPAALQIETEARPEITLTTDSRTEAKAGETVMASVTTRLDIVQGDQRAELILRFDESDRVDDLIKHGQKMVEVGYLAGARAYFKRAVEAGSGEAAVLLGATYDPAFIEKMGAQGIKPDLREARSWYGRAKQLGLADADAKLAELAQEWPDNRNPEQEAQKRASDSASQSEQPVAIVPAGPSSSGNDDWVGFSTDVNIRKAPSPTAETLRIAQKGEKLRVISRESKWVEVTDPASSETGWVYSRFTEPAQSPPQ
jgi:Bacterial SH3 domain